MRTCLIVSLILISLMKISGQTSYDLYEENLRLADSLRQNNHFEEASKFYDKALIIKPNESVTDYFKFAECLFYFKGLKTSIHKIQESIEIGGADLESILNYRGFDDLKCSKLFQDLVSNHKSYKMEPLWWSGLVQFRLL